MLQRPPSPQVCEAFGLSGVPTSTSSDEAWKVGPVALKRAADPVIVEGIASLLARVPDGPEFRLARPIPAIDGTWIVDGWAATTWLEGEPQPGRWVEIMATGEAFHRALSGLPRLGWLDRFDDPWRQADQASWSNQTPSFQVEFAPLVQDLLALRTPISRTNQLVHLDLGGNVLFSEDLPPGIIDLTLYWRPPGYSAAIVAVDCFEWEGAGPEVLRYFAERPDGLQLLVRAALFRTIRSAMMEGSRAAPTMAVHRRTFEELTSLTT